MTLDDREDFLQEDESLQLLKTAKSQKKFHHASGLSQVAVE